ncbi:DnaB-like helicase C-terminal domain-containing protein [Arcobacter aquimarinus]|uniref:DnaB-like helicase C-terminal domain-containing protein n=1 Tax=Arcobacter aquimarinus TaxID=1315211 RepID=UPI003BB04EEA
MNSIHSINIERVVLSSILFNPEEFEDIAEILKSKDFYLPAHKKIFEVMTQLSNEEIPIDEEFIRPRITAKEVDDSILIEILSANPIANSKAYATQIKDASIKRDLVALATTIKKVAIEDDISAAVALETIEDEFSKISLIDNSSSNKNLSEQMREFDENFNNLQNKPIGLEVGMKQFKNKLIFEPGDLVVIAARPSMGKTSLLLKFMNYWIKNDIGVLFDSLEMPSQKIIRRIIAAMNQENLSDLKKGVVKDIAKYRETFDFLSNTKNLILHDKSYVPISYLRAKARKILKKNPHIKVWAIDHLKYIKSKGENRALEVSTITKEMKAIAKEFGIVVIALSQLRRIDDKATKFRPQLTDLRESGSVEEDADIVIFPHRESYYDRTTKNKKEEPIHDADLIVAKCRDGEPFTVTCQFNGPTTSFGDFVSISYTNESGNNISQNEIIDQKETNFDGLQIFMD